MNGYLPPPLTPRMKRPSLALKETMNPTDPLVQYHTCSVRYGTSTTRGARAEQGMALSDELETEETLETHERERESWSCAERKST